MTAKEMFEELGYKEVDGYVGKMYEKETIERDKIFGEYQKIKHIHFYEKKVSVNITTCFGGKGIVDINELKAINKQVEELGWNNE